MAPAPAYGFGVGGSGEWGGWGGWGDLNVPALRCYAVLMLVG